VCLAAPAPALDELLAGAPESAALAMARRGLVDLVAGARPAGRSRAERRLHEALDGDPRTRGRFTLGATLPVRFGDRDAEVDLYDAQLALAVEVDGWYHHDDPEAYRRDRRKDVVLQRAGIFVLRFLEEDVWDRLDYLVDQVAEAITFRSKPDATARNGEPCPRPSRDSRS
jgi:hypothetical protein